nr:VOC family protein [Pusillimonas noertemannii]
MYKLDPEGNAVEVYADVVEDWRTARHGVFEKVKPEWIPGVTNEPLSERLYPNNPPIHVVPSSVFRARRVTHAGFVADDYENLYDYYTELIGLTPYVGDRGSEYCVLRGTVSTEGLSLFRRPAGTPQGMHHVGIEVKDESELDRALKKMAENGIALEREVNHPARRTVCILDPDGIRLQFYVNRQWDPSQLKGIDLQEALYLL